MGQCEICTKQMEYNAIESDDLLEKLEKTDIGRDVLKLRNENRQAISNFKTNLMSDKSFFKGKIVNTKREGYGQNYADCFNYFGYYKNDLPQGEGAIITDSHCLFGQFKAGVLQGKGKEWSEGTSFEGTFKNGQRVEGRLTNDNYTYSGQFKDDQYNGLGTLTLKNGIQYTGHFINGLFHGEGELHFQNNCVYKGGFKEGVYNGYGEYRWANGDFFRGQYRQGKRDGFGALRIGQIQYSGNWVNGVREGHGTLTHQSEFGFGTWRNNQLIEQ